MGVSRLKAREGSFTVEAALLTGVIFFVVIAIFLSAVYLHDRSVLYEMAAEYGECLRHMAEEPVGFDGGLRASGLDEQNFLRTNGYLSAEEGRTAETLFRMEAERRLLLSSVSYFGVGIRGREVTIYFAARFEPPLLTGLFQLLPIRLQYSGEFQYRWKLDPEEFVRLCRGIIWRKKE